MPAGVDRVRSVLVVECTNLDRSARLFARAGSFSVALSNRARFELQQLTRRARSYPLEL